MTVASGDDLGRIVEVQEQIVDENGNLGPVSIRRYGYDALGQLQDVYEGSAGTLVRRYCYDANGNRTAVIAGGSCPATPTITYDGQDRLKYYNGTRHHYNESGQLTSKGDAPNQTLYSYDELGNLRSVTEPDGTVVEYVIDGFNRRVGRKVNGVLEQGFLYGDQLNPVAELGGDNHVVSQFVYGTKPHVPDFMIRDDHTYRILSDHLGSVRLVVDANTGEVMQRLDYDEFGNMTVVHDVNGRDAIDIPFQPFGFAGGLVDRKTGLVRFGARDYDPQTGRWTAKDPILFGGGQANLYVYVGNDPLYWVDPSGLWVWGAGSSFAFVPGFGTGFGFGIFVSGGSDGWDLGLGAFGGTAGGLALGMDIWTGWFRDKCALEGRSDVLSWVGPPISITEQNENGAYERETTGLTVGWGWGVGGYASGQNNGGVGTHVEWGSDWGRADGQ